jgi:hypothetical protein
LQAALLASFRTMVAFYGFALVSEMPPQIRRGPNFAERSANWLSPNNHNHLRITRILRALRLLGLEAHAQAFFEALEAIYKEMPSRITATSCGFWWRTLETGLRRILTGHEGGNPGYKPRMILRATAPASGPTTRTALDQRACTG